MNEVFLPIEQINDDDLGIFMERGEKDLQKFVWFKS